MIFVLKQKGVKNVVMKSSHEIVGEKEIVDNLPPSDAQIIGYVAASESILAEKQEKDRIKLLSTK